MATLCLTFVGRSGSYLLQSLLDGHPEVLCVPPHAGVYLLSSLLDAFTSPQSAQSIKGFVGAIMDANPCLFTTGDHRKFFSQAADHMKFGVEPEIFRRHLTPLITLAIRQQKVSLQHVFNATHFAYAMARGQKIADAPVIVWQKHLFQGSDPQLLSVFQDVHRVICVRNPEITLNSHLQHHLHENPSPPLTTLPRRILGSFHEGAAVPAADTRAIAVRFEDMHARTELLMRGLCRHFSLAWDPVLLQTTVDGQPFYFPKNGKVIGGTNPARARETKTPHFSWLDRWHLRHGLAEAYRAWGYAGADKPLQRRLLEMPWLRRLLLAVPTKVQVKVLWIDLLEAFRNFRAENRLVREQMFWQAADGTKLVPLLSLDESPKPVP